MFPLAASARTHEKDLALLRRGIVANRGLGRRIPRIGGHRFGKPNPAVHVSGPYGLLGHRKVRIGKCADRHADQMGHALGFPPQAGYAEGAGMKGHGKAARRSPPEALGGAGERLDRRAGKEGCDAEQRTGASLAIEAVAKRHLDRLSGALEPQVSAVTGRLADHRQSTTGRTCQCKRPASPRHGSSFPRLRRPGTSHFIGRRFEVIAPA